MPTAYFPSLLASYVWSVVDPAVVEELGDDEFVFGGAGTGPWQFSDFDPANSLVMTPNPNYWDGTSPSLTELTWLFLTGPDAASAALELYQSGNAVSADVPLSLLETVTTDETLNSQFVRIAPQGSVRAIGMDFNQEPFNDVRVRRAVAMSIDRDIWANDIWEGTWAPAGGMLPPVLSTIASYTSPEGIAFDADAADTLLEDAGYPNAEGVPTITYFQASEDSDSDKARDAALLAMIKENSGIDIVHDTSLSMQQIVDQTADNGGSQFNLVWWWNIYNTPHLLTVVGDPDSVAMAGVFNWSPELELSGDFDPGADAANFQDLVGQADEEGDEATRNDQYRQAEAAAPGKRGLHSAWILGADVRPEPSPPGYPSGAMDGTDSGTFRQECRAHRVLVHHSHSYDSQPTTRPISRARCRLFCELRRELKRKRYDRYEGTA